MIQTRRPEEKGLKKIGGTQGRGPGQSAPEKLSKRGKHACSTINCKEVHRLGELDIQKKEGGSKERQ